MLFPHQQHLCVRSDNTEALHRKECRKCINEWRENKTKQNALFQPATFSDPDVSVIKKKKENPFQNSKEKFLVLTSCSAIPLHTLKSVSLQTPIHSGTSLPRPRSAILLLKVMFSLFTIVCAFPHLDASLLPNCSELSKSWHTEGTEPQASQMQLLEQSLFFPCVYSLHKWKGKH